ncbi:MAG: acyltransferase [Planctomycetes bacterium]|nr:acyltransferase [Planctomycetota bacterium]
MPASPAGRWLLDSDHNRAVVDGLRAIGIMLVVAFHGAFVFAKVLPRPQLESFIDRMPGVLNIVWQALGSEMVFFTSGFLLAYLLLREHARYGSIDLRDFWLRRGSRIVPLFLLALLVFMIGRRFHWDRIATNLLFCSRISGHFGLTANGGKNYIPVGWSLEVMVHAYLLLPFLVLGVLRTRWPLVAALALTALSVLPRYLALAADLDVCALPAYQILDTERIPQIHKDLYYLTWFRLTPFVLGLAAAVAATHHRAWLERWCASPWRSTTTMALGLALVAASGFQPLHRSDGWIYAAFSARDWLWFWTCQRAVLTAGLALVLLVALSVRQGAPALVGRALAWRGFRPVSHGIYSVYLFHFVGLIPAALLVFLPAVVQGIADSPSWNRKVLLEHMSAAIGSASVWQYLLMVAAAVWLATKLATWLTRVVEAPLQRRLRERRRTRPRALLPHIAAEERQLAAAREAATAAAHGGPS